MMFGRLPVYTIIGPRNQTKVAKAFMESELSGIGEDVLVVDLKVQTNKNETKPVGSDTTPALPGSFALGGHSDFSPGSSKAMGPLGGHMPVHPGRRRWPISWTRRQRRHRCLCNMHSDHWISHDITG